MKFQFRIFGRWVEVTLSVDNTAQHLGLLDCDELTKLRDELAEALADAEYHLARISPEEPK